MIKLSVAIATYNEEQNLRACLSSVSSWADEIVLVDGGSTDKTLDVARQLRAKIIRTDNHPIFHINKQKALDACRGDWILQLDADEVVSSQLKEEILSIVKPITKNRPLITYKGYYIPRRNFFLNHWLAKGGQYPDYVVRLFRRGKGKFPCKSVHEQIEIDGEVGYLRNALFHYTYKSLAEYWKKAGTYTALTALEMKNNNVSTNGSEYFFYNAVKPIQTFLSLYIRHKGFMDGVYGFLFALFSALHFPIAYRKYLKVKSS